MPETDIDGPQELSLSLATTAAPDELWNRWQDLRTQVEQAGEYMSETGRLWKETTDPEIKEWLWGRYEAEARNYRVLASWKDVFYAAFIFSTDGAECAELDVSS